MFFQFLLRKFEKGVKLFPFKFVATFLGSERVIKEAVVGNCSSK